MILPRSLLTWRLVFTAVIVAAISLVLASSALASTVIDTTPAWNNTTGSGLGFCCFGYPNTSTMGQTVTVPATETNLSSFTFYANLPTGLQFRGEVYAWNGSSATGPALYESPPMHTTQFSPGQFQPCDYTVNDQSRFQPITFNTGGVTVTPGAQYVLFVTISKDYAAAAGQGAGCLGAIHRFGNPPSPTPDPGGTLWYLNDGGNPNLWTSPWGSGSSLGWGWLAFKASFGPLDSDLALAQPSNVTVDATSPAGAVVTLNPAVTDESLSTVTVSCLPASGSTFAIGDTTVTCTATDTDGDTNSPVVSQPFNVHVKGAAEQLSDLANAVKGVGSGTSLADKVALVQADLAANDISHACGTLNAFINAVSAQLPKKTAAPLIADARQIEAVIPCTS